MPLYLLTSVVVLRRNTLIKECSLRSNPDICACAGVNGWVSLEAVLLPRLLDILHEVTPATRVTPSGQFRGPHVNFPTHYQDHTLDLVITSSLSNLSPEISFSFDTPSDHYPIFTLLNILPTPRPAPAPHSFRRISSINIEAFMRDLFSSDLVLNPPSSLDDLLCSYNATLSSLLDKHAPIITKSGSHSNNPWYTSYLQAFKSFRRRLERTYVCYKRTRDPQLLSELKSATNRYH